MAVTIELATIALDVDARVPPDDSGDLGYGQDLSCGTDFTATMESVDPFSLLAIGEALVRRWDTPRGSVPDDEDYGYELRQFLHEGTTTQELLEIAGQLRLEGEKDDRIERLRVVVQPLDTIGRAWRVTASVVPVDVRLGPFRLTLRATDVALLLEALEEQSP